MLRQSLDDSFASCRFPKGFRGIRSAFPFAFWQLLKTFAPVASHPPKQASHPAATNGTVIQDVVATTARQTPVQVKPHAQSSKTHSYAPSSSFSARSRPSSTSSARRRRLVLTGQVASVPPLGSASTASTGDVSPVALKQFAFPSFGNIA